MQSNRIGVEYGDRPKQVEVRVRKLKKWEEKIEKLHFMVKAE